MAASNFMEDHRYVFEKPGCLRLVFYLNGYNVLEHTEEPVGRQYRAKTVDEVFQLGADECAEAAAMPGRRKPRDPRSRGLAEEFGPPEERPQGDASSSGESGALKDAQILALQAEMAALKASVAIALKEQATAKEQAAAKQQVKRG